MDRAAWQVTVPGVTESDTTESFTFTFPGGSVVKNLPAVQETQGQSQSQEDPLQKVMATHSSTLAWEIPWREEPGGLQSVGSKKSWTRLKQ